MIAHQESHLYPCHLALSQISATTAPKFIFNSPLNSYSTVFDTSNSECDFLSHEGIRYKNVSTLQLETNQRLAIFCNSSTLSCVEGPKMGNLIYLDPQENIISDIVSLNLTTHCGEHVNGSF